MIKSFEFTKEIKIQILQDMKETGETWEQCSAKYRLPEMFIMSSHDPDELIEYEGEKMTLAQFKERYPYRKCITIRKRKYDNE